MAIERIEVIYAFLYILGRAPESEDVVRYHANNFPTVDALRRHLFGTDEFRNVYSLLTDYHRDQSFDFTRRRLGFVHIPKTGGTTVISAISAVVDAAKVFPDRYKLSGYAAAFLAEFDYFMGHYGLHEIRYLPGDVYTFTVLREPRARIISQYYYHRSRMLANAPISPDPLLEKARLPIKEYLADAEIRVHPSVDNAQCRALFSPLAESAARPGRAMRRQEDVTRVSLLENAIENLMTFDAVGTTEGLDAFMQLLAGDLGLEIKRAPERKMVTEELHAQFPAIYAKVDYRTIDGEVSALLDELVELDEQLYDVARKSLDRRLREGAEMRPQFSRAM
jgi:hypothetical protein